MSGDARIRAPVAALAVAMVALVAYALAIGNGFAYDDVPILLGDPRLAGPDLGAIITGGYWQNADLALYRPITTLSFALDWTLAPGSAAWLHLTNILLHAGASVLAFLLLCRLFPVGAAWAGGVVFALHPVHVEAVANIVGRAELLAGVFVFGACLAWLRETRGRNALVAGLFGLALLSKESAIMLPALLLLLDATGGTRMSAGIAAYARRHGVGYLSLGAVAASYLVLRVAVLGTLTPGHVDPVLEVAPSAGARILTALQAWPEFVRLLFFPATLLADYGPRILLPADGLTGAAALGLAILAATVLAGVAAMTNGARRAGLGLLWFPVAVLPISNLLFPIGVLVAERTLYVPSLAASLAVAGLVVVSSALSPRLRRPAAVAALAVMMVLAARTMVRIPDWRDTEAIMAAQLRDRPDSYRGYWFAARFMRGTGDLAAASAAYDRALVLWPHRRALVVEAAAHAAEARQGERASALARMLIDHWPDDVSGYRMLAGFALDAGNPAVARDALRDGLRLAPTDPMLLQMAAALDSIQSGGQ